MALFGFLSGKSKTPHQLLGEGNLKGALKGFLELHKKKPAQPIYMNQIAELYAKLGKPEKALSFYIKVGDHFVKRGFINKAVVSFKKALQITPNDEEVFKKLENLSDDASRYMLSDNLFQKTDGGDETQDDSFDVTHEEISIAEESLKMELEEASSEFLSLNIKDVPGYKEDGEQEVIALAEVKTETLPDEVSLSESPDEITDEEATEKVEDIEPEPVIDQPELGENEDDSKAVFKNRDLPPSDDESSENSQNGVFTTVEDALEAAFSFTPIEQKIPAHPGMLHDPNLWPIFKGIDRDTFMDIIMALESRSYNPGDYIIKQGEDGAEMFLIVDGEVEVRIQAKELEKKVAILKSGEFFGEGAILTKSKRNANIKALKKTEVLTLSKKEFIILIKKHPQILNNMKLPFLSRKKVNKQILGGE